MHGWSVSKRAWMNFLRHLSVGLPIAVLCIQGTVAQVDGWVSISETEYVVRGLKDSIDLEVSIKDGFHIQANQLEDPLLIPSEISFRWPTGFSVDTLLYPPSYPFIVPGMASPLKVYSGEIRIRIVLAMEQGIISGRHTIPGRFRYQACDSTKCYFPRELPLKLHIRAIN